MQWTPGQWRLSGKSSVIQHLGQATEQRPRASIESDRPATLDNVTLSLGKFKLGLTLSTPDLN